MGFLASSKVLEEDLEEELTDVLGDDLWLWLWESDSPILARLMGTGLMFALELSISTFTVCWCFLYIVSGANQTDILTLKRNIFVEFLEPIQETLVAKEFKQCIKEQQ